VSENHTDDRAGVEPKHRSFDSPEHRPLRDARTNPRGVRHIDETAQDQMAVEDRPRVRAAQDRRATMIAAAPAAAVGSSGLTASRRYTQSGGAVA
jgi:hypothetical protein